MTKTFNLSKLLYGVPFLIVGVLFLISRSAIFYSNSSALSLGITLDFIITIPLVYFFLIRKNKAVPKITVLSVFVICILLASLILPKEHQAVLSMIKSVAIPVVELSVVSFIIFKTRQVILSFKKTNNEQIDFYDALLVACGKVLPGRIGRVLASEIAVVYYLFKGQKGFIQKENDYTYFKKSGIKSMIIVFIGLILMETLVLHILVDMWNPVVAWVLTGLSMYTCLQVVALLRSMNLRLISVDHARGVLHLKYGFFSQTSISLKEIVSIEKNKKSLPDDKSIVQFSPLGMLDTHNIILKTREAHVIQRIYGIRQSFSGLAIYVDDVDRFVKEIGGIIDPE